MRNKKNKSHYNHYIGTTLGEHDSTFLRLPLEIRNIIYGFALTKGTIDLCPGRYVATEDVQKNEELQERIAKYRAKDPDRRSDPWSIPQFDDVRDLQYVRKQLAVGLLRSCRQINDEASAFFWSDNIWRFTYDYKCIVVHRFLSTIGPRARQQIRLIELLPPVLEDRPWFPKLATSGPYLKGHRKNHPKLRLMKISDKVDRASIKNQVAFRRTIIQSVCRFIGEDMRNSLLELRFIVSSGVNLSHSSYVEDSSEEVELHCQDKHSFHFPPVLFDAKCLQKVLVIEAGGTLTGQFYPMLLTNEEFRVLHRKGSTLVKVHRQLLPNGVMTCDFVNTVFEENTSCDLPTAPTNDDYYAGFIDLFEQPVVETSRGDGSRMIKTSTNSKSRILRGFGGCRFRYMDGHICEYSGNYIETGSKVYRRLPTKKCEKRTLANGIWASRCSWRAVKCMMIKKPLRLARHDFTEQKTRIPWSS